MKRALAHGNVKLRPIDFIVFNFLINFKIKSIIMMKVKAAGWFQYERQHTFERKITRQCSQTWQKFRGWTWWKCSWLPSNLWGHLLIWLRLDEAGASTERDLDAAPRASGARGRGRGRGRGRSRISLIFFSLLKDFNWFPISQKKKSYFCQLEHWLIVL